MTPFEQQFQELAKMFPGTIYSLNTDGSFVITVPSVKVPSGWTSKEVTVRFIAPVGYPAAKPDCFWTDPDLKLEGNRVPQSTGPTPLPNGPSPLLWFSWHVDTWSPNSDTLLTYVHVIEKRFRELR
jgi:hypothetical protein